jgi:glycosyltransferase involved in cell wall biosynthesis
MHMHNPKVSVIMAAYNAEKYIAKAIESILLQTFRDLELIIVNDASTDGTLGIAKRYGEKDVRIRLIDLVQNVGTNHAKNKALSIARGKYIAILDNDDIALPDRIEKQFNYLELHKDIFLIGSAAKIIDETGMTVGASHPITRIKKLKQTLVYKNAIYHPTVMYRNDGLRYRNVPYGAEDYDLYLRILSRGDSLANLPDVLCLYRVVSTSLSRMNAGKIAITAEKVREFYRERLESGTDSLEDFDWREIDALQFPTTNMTFVSGEIEALLKLHKFDEVLKIVRDQFTMKNHSLKLFLIATISMFDGALYRLFKRPGF